MTHSAAKLSALLEHARRSCPYWAIRIPANASSAPQQALAALTPLTRQDLQAHHNEMLTAGVDRRGWRSAKTTGTTGAPIEFVLDEAAQAAQSAALGRYLDARLRGPAWRAADFIVLALHSGAVSRALPSPFAERAHIVKWNLLNAWQLPDGRFADVLAQLTGCVVSTLPSVVELVCARLDAARAPAPKPLAVFLSGEELTVEGQARIGRVLHAPVLGGYSLTEAGFVAGACAQGGYHVDESAQLVEIDAGEILVTPLENTVMPLFRYRTGDRGAWIDEPCGCGLAGRRLALTAGRRPSRVLTATGRTVNVVRFAKLLAELPVTRVALKQTGVGAITVGYEALAPLPQNAMRLVASVVRAELGPETEVSFQRAADALAAAEPSGTRATSAAEPAGPEPEAVARWLAGRLAGAPGLLAATLTGSALEPGIATCLSDIDLVLLVHNPSELRWAALVRELRARLRTLSITVDAADDLHVRAPLLVCRLLAEHMPVTGDVDGLLVRPSQSELAREARYWAQGAAAHLFHRLTGAPSAPEDLLAVAAVAGKHALTALRYRGLARGERQTAASAVLAAARNDLVLAQVLPAVCDMLEVARSQRPPPVAGHGHEECWLAAALACVRLVR